MANGDKAAAVGWNTFASTQSASQGYDNDNYALDRVAEQFTTLRDQVLPAVNQPIFSVRRGTNTYRIAGATWTALPATPYASPTVNTGFNGWVGGVLTIAKAGLYRVATHVQFEEAINASNGYARLAVEVTKNSTTAGTTNSLARNVVGPGSLSVDASQLVRLVAGDLIRVLAFQRDTGAPSHALDTDAADLAFSVEWVRA